MRRFVFVGYVCLCALPAHSLCVAEEGRAVAGIVLCHAPQPAEQTAAKELAAYLGAVTGGVFTITGEAEAGKLRPPRIYVGPTEFAKAQGIDAAAMGEEEWLIRSHGDDLVLAGGRPRGTLYAVYHFLEDVVGVHWWNAYEESVPHQPALQIDDIDRRGKPAFRCRDIYMLYGNDGGRFAARNRLNRDGDARISAEYGGAMDYGPPYHVHTFNMYVPEADFDVHPEWFSLINGKREKERSQLCLTNPELRAFMLGKLKAYIEQARAAAQANNEPAPSVYSISQNDWTGMCECAACQAIAKAEESEAGPLLDFVNYLAEAIAADYPEASIDTLAYMMTQKPPKSIRPRDNVIIRLCDTGSNFTLPITDPRNQEFHDHLLRWSAIAKNLRIWDYAVTYAPHYGIPLPTVHTYAPDYRFYAEHNVEGVFTEHEFPVLADMRDFKIWMMMKTLEDPYQDMDALVRTFTDGFCGAAGEFVRQYLARLEKASEAHTSYLSMGASPSQYRYLDLPFMLDAQALFDQAEQAVAGDDTLVRRVRFVRLPLDRAAVILFRDLLTQWERGGHTPETMPLDRDAIAARCRDTWSAQIRFRVPAAQQEDALAEIDAELNPILARPAIVRTPEKFRELPPAAVFDFSADMSRNWNDVARRVPDAGAESGFTNRLELSDEDMARYALPMPWGLYDVINKQGGGSSTIQAADVAGPGYHWYRLGAFPIAPSYYVWFFWSWIIQFDVDRAHNPEQPQAAYDVWASIKFEGPGFPHGKPGDKNAISVERVVLVKQ